MTTIHVHGKGCKAEATHQRVDCTCNLYTSEHDSAWVIVDILRDYYVAAESYMVGQRIGRMPGKTIENMSAAQRKVMDALDIS